SGWKPAPNSSSARTESASQVVTAPDTVHGPPLTATTSTPAAPLASTFTVTRSGNWPLQHPERSSALVLPAVDSLVPIVIVSVNNDAITYGAGGTSASAEDAGAIATPRTRATARAPRRRGRADLITVNTPHDRATHPSRAGLPPLPRKSGENAVAS